MSAIPQNPPLVVTAEPRAGNRAALAFALSLGVHGVFFALLGWSLHGERQPTVIPVELVFGTIAPLRATPSAPLANDDIATSDAAPASAEPRVATADAGTEHTTRAPTPRFDATTPRVEKPAFVHAPYAMPELASLRRPGAPADAASRDADATLELAVLDWLRRHQRYPRAARRAGLEGTTHVRFVIDRAGALREAEVVASSGHAVLDRAALELLQRAAPYPPLPARVRVGEVELTLPVEYRLSADAARG